MNICTTAQAVPEQDLHSHRIPKASSQFSHSIFSHPDTLNLVCVGEGAVHEQESRVEVKESVANRGFHPTVGEFVPESQNVYLRRVREPSFRSKIDEFVRETQYVNCSIVG